MGYKLEVAGFFPQDEKAGQPAHGNHNLYVPFLGETLRGRYRQGDTPIPTNGQPVPEIPGIHITVNTAKNEVLLHDPLHESRDLARIAEALQKNGVKGNRPMDDEKFSETDERMEQWHSLARWGIANGQLLLLEGSVPAPPKAKAEPATAA